MNRKSILSLIALFLILTTDTSHLTLSRRMFVVSSPEDMPDLRIDGAVCFPGPIAGFRTTLVVTVENVGRAPARPLVVSVKWGCCQLINGTSELASGATASVLFYPLFPQAGNLSVEVTADPNHEVQESDETNNVLRIWQRVSLLKIVTKPPTELDLGVEQATWGYGVDGWVDEGNLDNYLPTKEQLPAMRGLPDYNLIGRLDPNNPNSGFESQKPEPACGTTSLASILRYLSKKDSTYFHHNIIDESIRGGDVLEIWTDPFSVARYASDKGFEARVYVDGDFEKIKWFIDRGISVMICISTEGTKPIWNGHWVVPVSYWEDSVLTRELGSHTMIGYYNPWGYQSAIPQSRFDLYWLEQDFLGVTLWNRAYVAICNRPAPPDMPQSNAGSLQGYYMSVVQGFGQCLNTLGVGVDMLQSDDPWEVIAGLGVTIAGALMTAVYALAVVLPNLIGGWIKTAVEYIWDGIKTAAEWIWEGIKSLACDWFGWGCKSKNEYFYYFYSTSPSAECSSLVNDMVRVQAIGYIFSSQVAGTVPIYEYAEVDQQSLAVLRYFISTDPNLPGTGVPGITRHLFGQLGFVPEAPIAAVPCEKLVDCLTTYGFGYDASIANVYVPQYYLNGSKVLWQFNSTTYNHGFLSPDETAGTKTFPYVAVDLEGEETGYHFTREYIAAYIHYNQLPGTVPLYRFFDPEEEEFYLTTNLEDKPKELRPVKEMVLSGLVGYIFPTQQPNTVPLYRYYAKDKGADYLFTTKEIQSDKFTKEGIVGYVYPVEQECTASLWVFCFRKVKEE